MPRRSLCPRLGQGRQLASQTFPGKEGGGGSLSIQGPKPDAAGRSLPAVRWPLFYYWLRWREGTPLL